MFEDRRGRGDRRAPSNHNKAPHCRRQRERRNILRQYHPQPWWLQTNYAEELQPPLLDTDLTSPQNPSNNLIKGRGRAEK
jgi:hypothetical protein